MKKTHYTKSVTLLYLFGILSYMLMFFVFITRGELNCFLTDDNAMQWEPMIRASFDELFSTGKIPYIDLYQFKGYDIYMEGYYGQSNPLMFICYCLSRFIFSFRLSVTSIYVILSAILGVMSMFWLLRECSVKHSTMILTLFGYASCSFFYLYAFYYFTFNNYWFIPFLIWSIIRVRDTRSAWFIPGIILAFSLLLGHVQYTFYYCIVYGIITIMLSLRSNKPKMILSAFTNAAIFVVLSLPNLMTQMKAGKLREFVLGKNPSEFFTYDIDPYCLFVPQIAQRLFGCSEPENRENYQLYIGMGIFSILAFLLFIPLIASFFNDFGKWFSNQKKIQKLIEDTTQKSSPKEIKLLKYLIMSLLLLFTVENALYFYLDTYLSIVEFTAVYALITLGCVLLSVLGKSDFMLSSRFLKILASIYMLCNPFQFTILAIFYTLYLCKKRRIKEVSPVHSMAWAAMAAALFFLFFSMGRKTPVGSLLSVVPVISGFRFLYKCGFIFIPLLFFVGAVKLDSLKLPERSLKRVRIASALLSLISIVNVFHFYGTDNHEYIRNSALSLTELNSYVEQTDKLVEEQNIDRNNYRYLTFINNQASVNFDYVYYSNTVALHKYTKNFATSNRLFSITGYDNSFSETSFEQSDHIISEINDNAMCQEISDLNSFWNNLKDEEYKEIFEKQMIDNSIRYVIVDKNDYITQKKFEELMDRCPKLSVSRTFDGLNGVMFYELDGVNPLVCSESGKQIDIDPKLSELKFTANFPAPENITLSFTYDSHYRLELTDSNGSKSLCTLTSNDDGYLRAQIPEGEYSAKLFYEDKLTETSLIFSLITHILMTLSYLIIITKKPCKLFN